MARRTPALRQVHRPKVVLWPDGTSGSRIDISAYVGSFRTQKAIHTPMGTWEVSLLPYQGGRGPMRQNLLPDLAKITRPNGVISIGYDEPGGIMLGLVDSVAQTRNTAGPQASRSLSLSGSDFGKTLARDHIVHASLTVADTPDFLTKVAAVTGPKHSLLQALPGVWGPIVGRDSVPTFLGASVQEVVTWLLEAAPALTVPLMKSLGGTGRPGDYLRTENTITTWNDGRVWSEAPHTFQGTIWDFVRRILDEDFYEAWLDSSPNGRDVPHLDLIIRPKPYDEPALNFLPTHEDLGIDWPGLTTRVDGLPNHEITPELMLAENLGFTDADVYAFYLVTSAHTLLGTPDAMAEGLYYPAVDTFALARTGLRAYQAQLSLLAADVVDKQRREWEADYDGEVAHEVVEFRNRLLNWYRLNEYMEAGQIKVQGRDRYRAGDPVFLPWLKPSRGGITAKPGMRFYAPAVTHEYNALGQYTTTFQLMRGHNTPLITQAKLDIRLSAPVTNPSHLATTQ